MQGMMITTPDGHNCRLTCTLRDNETSVTLSHGDLSVQKSSKQKGDINLIESAMREMDDLLTNLRESNPRLEEIPWW
ncbi:MAG: hypothetical protein ACYDCO_26520 [Armatimonadota bacterium]